MTKETNHKFFLHFLTEWKTSLISSLFGLIIGIIISKIHLIINEQNLNLLCFIIIFLLTLLGYTNGVIINHLVKYIYIDTITNLNNRNYFNMMFSQVIKKTKNKKCNCSIAIIDIDNFKIINDTFGHAEGDNVLKMVSTIIKNNVRKNDVVVRYGGDEFAIIFFDISSEGAYQIAERVRQAVNVNEFFINKTKINLTISVGIVSTEQTSDMPNIMLLADKCLYTAKKSKNMVYELNVKLATVN